MEFKVPRHHSWLILCGWSPCILHTSGRVFQPIRHKGIIEGPKGTGKTTSLLYLWQKLKDTGKSFLAISPSIDGEIVSVKEEYFRQFIELFNTEGKRAVEVVIRSSEPGVLFADTGHVVKADPKSLFEVLSLVSLALERKWFVVLSTSSGSGWTVTGRDNYYVRDIRRMLDGLEQKMQDVILSQNFTSEEFVTYTKMEGKRINYNIADIEYQTHRNPLLLSYFNGCKNDSHYFRGLQKMNCLSMYMINDLIRLVQRNDNKYISTFEDCLKWTSYCTEKTSLSMSELKKCHSSYLVQENLIFFFFLNEKARLHKTRRSWNLLFHVWFQPSYQR